MASRDEVWQHVEAYLSGYRHVLMKCVGEGVYPAASELEAALRWFFRHRDFMHDRERRKYAHAGATDAMLDAVQARLDECGWMRRAPVNEQCRVAEPWLLNGPVGHDGN